MPPTHRNIDNSPSWMCNPQFVSEAHATKSRQSTNGLSLGPCWEAPTHRVIEAITQAVVLAPVKTSKPPAKPLVRKPAAVAKAPKPPPKLTPVGHSSSDDSSDDGLPKAWGPILFPGILAAPPDPVNIAVAVATTNAAANTMAASAPTNAAVARDAHSHSTYSIFGTDTEDNDSAKGKHHATISAQLAKLDPKVPRTITATVHKCKAVANLSHNDSGVASCDKKPAAKQKKTLAKSHTASTRKRVAPVSYKPTVVRKSSSSDRTKKTSNKKA
jgi:hypothetical protein